MTSKSGERQIELDEAEARWVLLGWCIQGFRSDGAATTNSIFGAYSSLFGGVTTQNREAYNGLRASRIIVRRRGNQRAVIDIGRCRFPADGPVDLVRLVHDFADRLESRGLLKATRPLLISYAVSSQVTTGTVPVVPCVRREAGDILAHLADGEAVPDTPLARFTDLLRRIECRIERGSRTSVEEKRQVRAQLRVYAQGVARLLALRALRKPKRLPEGEVG
ncbi:hypothetical protein HOI83_00480 [Candidatus Uhrbacteria bacterium]|jgi:hypothetical protein|nr:hypothetical protein [Candidatus Uhrbacteria bacterium]